MRIKLGYIKRLPVTILLQLYYAIYALVGLDKASAIEEVSLCVASSSCFVFGWEKLKRHAKADEERPLRVIYG